MKAEKLHINNRNDFSRLLELILIEGDKLWENSATPVEYYSKVDSHLFEYVNPELSYNYIKRITANRIQFLIDKQGNDPILMVQIAIKTKYLVFDFFFPENKQRFDQVKGLVGKNYLDTVCKIYRDELLPYAQNNHTPIYFNAYNNTDGSSMRSKVFTKIVEKFTDKNNFNVKIRGGEFFITPISN